MVTLDDTGEGKVENTFCLLKVIYNNLMSSDPLSIKSELLGGFNSPHQSLDPFSEPELNLGEFAPESETPPAVDLEPYNHPPE